MRLVSLRNILKIHLQLQLGFVLIEFEFEYLKPVEVALS